MGVPQTTVCVEWVWNKTSAAIAQLGERQTEDLKVPGSIPGLGISENVAPFLCVSQTALHSPCPRCQCEVSWNKSNSSSWRGIHTPAACGHFLSPTAPIPTAECICGLFMGGARSILWGGPGRRLQTNQPVLRLGWPTQAPRADALMLD